MMQRLGARWQEFRRSRPGRRFQELHDRQQSDGGSESGGRKVLVVLLGGALVVAGVFLLPFPGPGMLIIVLGLALLSVVVPQLAPVLDRGELWLWAARARALAWWAHASWPVRVVIGVMVAGMVGAGGYIMYRWLVG
jgi:hypothetical protein